MYCAKTDPKLGLAVWCWSTATVSNEDWRRHLSDMLAVREWNHLTARPCVLLYMHDTRFVPDARQRKDIAEYSRHPNYRPNLAVLSQSPMIRGAMRAFAWLTPKQPYRIAPFADIHDALRWLEEDRGKPLPQLLQLLGEALRELGIQSSIVEQAIRDSVQPGTSGTFAAHDEKKQSGT